MNRLPPQPGPPEDADERYRRASALDPSRPSEAVRRAVLAHAARLAADRPRRPPARRWRPVLFGTLAAAALAGILVVPRYFTPGAGADRALAPAPQAARAPEPPAAIAPPPDETRSSPAAPAPRTEPYTDVKPRQLADVRRQSAPHEGGSSAKAPQVAARSTAGNATDEAAARQDAITASAPISGGRSAQAEASAGIARRAPSFVVAAPAPADSDPGVALRRAAEAGDVATLQSLMTPQTDINARDAEGRTALMLAALHDQSAAVSTLLERGADPNIADLHGVTPLAAAVTGGHQAIAEALQRYGAR